MESKKFNLITPNVDEDLHQFHLKLAEQAEKCGFQCNNCNSNYRQRMIRDRLILFLDNYLCTEIISYNDDPTVEDILKIYDADQMFQKSPAWTYILPYLPLHDLDTFARSHPKLKKIVYSYLEKGHGLLIDPNTLMKHPVSNQKDFYAAYSCATNLVIDGAILGEMAILQIFPSILELTLMNMSISLDDLDLYPTGMRKLTLVNNKIEFEDDFEWLLEQLENLESVHCDSNKGACYLSTTVCSAIGNCKQLKSLTLDNWESTLREIKTLQHLRILQNVDWKCKAEIDTLQIPSVDVFVHEIPRAANLILRLNDDCLHHVIEFLDSTDRLNFQSSHARFQIARVQEYVLDLLRCPFQENEEYYKRIGPLVTSLGLNEDISYAEPPQLMSLFSNITEMVLGFDIQEAGNLEAIIPTGLKLLKLERKITGHSKDLSIIFRRLNPTLETLVIYSINEDILEAMTELRNIKTLNVGNLKVTLPFLKFQEFNKLSMRSLNISKKESVPEHEKAMWNLISQMRNLKNFEFDSNSTEPGQLPSLGEGALPGLEHLYLNCHNEDGHRDFLMSLDGSELKTLRLYGRLSNYNDFFNAEMKHLWKICIINESKWRPNNETLFLLPSLRVLGFIEKEESSMLPLIKGLPQLIDLYFENDFGEDVLIPIYNYVRQTNRTFKCRTNLDDCMDDE